MRHPILPSLLFFVVGVVAAPFSAVAQSGQLPPLNAASMVRKLNPVYPLDQLLKGKTGWAEVRFMVDYSGRAVMTSVSSSSDPVFGQALLAEIEANEFIPPRTNGQPQLVLSGQRFNFDGEASLDASEKRILAELRQPIPVIVSIADLDKPLVATRQEAPVYPYALQSDGISGRAEIAYIIDHDGHAVLPKVLSASQDDFGWSAATAVSRWRFQPPVKGGQKVDARATVVIKFDHTKNTATW